MKAQEIISLLPYTEPFLFVDTLEEISENGVRGNYTFKKEAFFYKGHFKDHPVTPGVILTECCAQIGLVSLGIFLINDAVELQKTKIALVQSTMDFFEPVFPGETVTVVSEKVYYRFRKLKCKVSMFNAQGILICSGILSGMINKNSNE